MTKKIKKPIKNEQMKYEIVKELGLSAKVDKNGWAHLTSYETGKIGGLIAARKRQSRKN